MFFDIETFMRERYCQWFGDKVTEFSQRIFSDFERFFEEESFMNFKIELLIVCLKMV